MEVNIHRIGASPVAQSVKKLPALQETRVRSLDREDPLEKWRRKWQPTPVFLPGESHGQRSLVGYSPWHCKELDMTEATEHKVIIKINKILHILLKYAIMLRLLDIR